MITSTSFKLAFRLDQTPKVFEITDLEDYSLQGAVNNDIVGNLNIVGPDGEVLYNNAAVGNPDVVKATSDTNVIPINLPLLSNGDVEPGRYIVTYTATDTSDSSQAQVVKTFDFCYNAVEISLEMESDCITPLLTSTDTTNYVVDGVTPTIVRDHKIHFPVVTGASPISAITPKLTTNSFYTQTNTSVLVSTLTYDYGDDVCIIDELTGSEELDVECDSSVCDLYCCLFGMYNAYKDAQGSNRILAKDLREKWLEAESIRSLIKDSYNCNKEANLSNLINDVLKLGNCQPGCGCADDQPVAVVGLTTTLVNPGSSSEVIVEGGNNIFVDEEVAGDTTKYTVNLDPATKTKIDSLNANTEVTGGSGVTVNQTTGAEGQAIYDVNIDSGDSGAGAFFIYRVQIDPNKTPVVSLYKSKIYDPVLNEPNVSFVSDGGGGATPASAFLNKHLRVNVSNFGAAAVNYDYFPTTEIVAWVRKSAASSDLLSVDDLRLFNPHVTRILNIPNGVDVEPSDFFMINFTNGGSGLLSGNGLLDLVNGDTYRLREFYLMIKLI